MAMFRTPICRAWHDVSQASALLQVLFQAWEAAAGDGDVPVSGLWEPACWRWRYSCFKPVGASLLAMAMIRTPICRAWPDVSRASALLQVLPQACGRQLAGDGDGDVQDPHLPRPARRLAGKRAPTGPVSSLWEPACWRWRCSGPPSAAPGTTPRGQARSYKSCLRPVGGSLLAMAMAMILFQACGSQLAGDDDVRDTHLPRLA